MSTDSQKYLNQIEPESRHSAFAEFSRDERRPAVLLLSALLLAVLFFAIGLLFGRWTAEPETLSAAKPDTASAQAPAAAQPTPEPASNAGNTAAATSPATHSFTVFVTSFDTSARAQSFAKTLRDAGYSDVRTAAPSAGQMPPAYAVLVGHYTQDQARNIAQRMLTSNDSRLRNAKVIDDDSGQ